MSIRTCASCKCPCQLITLNCFFSSFTALSQDDISTDKLIFLIDQAQSEYIEPILGDCFDELCTAISNSELDITNVNYAPLDIKWETLIHRLTPLLVVGVDKLYHTRYGLTKITKERVEYDKVAPENVKTKQWSLSGEVKRYEAYLQEWLCANAQTYPCLDVTCNKCSGTSTCGCNSCKGDLLKYEDDGDCRDCSEDPSVTFGFTTTKHVKTDPREDPNYWKRNNYR